MRWLKTKVLYGMSWTCRKKCGQSKAWHFEHDYVKSSMIALNFDKVQYNSVHIWKCLRVFSRQRESLCLVLSLYALLLFSLTRVKVRVVTHGNTLVVRITFLLHTAPGTSVFLIESIVFGVSCWVFQGILFYQWKRRLENFGMIHW